MKGVNFYSLLGVSIFASDEEIKSAYFRKIKQYHPDTYQGNKKEAENITASLNQAYSVLSDKVQKAKYDEQFGFDKERIAHLKKWKKEQARAQKNANDQSGAYAQEKQRQTEAQMQKEFGEQTKVKDEKIKTNIFTKQPRKDAKAVKRKVYSPEEMQNHHDRLVLDCIIIALLFILILLVIFK